MIIEANGFIAKNDARAGRLEPVIVERSWLSENVENNVPLLVTSITSHKKE